MRQRWEGCHRLGASQTTHLQLFSKGKGGAEEADEIIICEIKEAGPVGQTQQKVTAVKTSWPAGKRVKGYAR